MTPEWRLSKPEQLRRLGIRAVCRQAGVPDRSGEFVTEGKSVRDVQRALIGEGALTLGHVSDADIKSALCGGL